MLSSSLLFYDHPDLVIPISQLYTLFYSSLVLERVHYLIQLLHVIIHCW
jgi:hypothetical protein